MAISLDKKIPNYEKIKEYVRTLKGPFKHVRLTKFKDYSISVQDPKTLKWISIKNYGASNRYLAFITMIQLKRDFNIPFSSESTIPLFKENWEEVILTNIGYVWDQVRKHYGSLGLKEECLKSMIHEMVWFFLYYKATSYNPRIKGKDGKSWSMKDWFTKMMNDPVTLKMAYERAINTDNMNDREGFNNGATNEKMFYNSKPKRILSSAESSILDKIDQMDCKDSLVDVKDRHREVLDKVFIENLKKHILINNNEIIPGENEMMIKLVDLNQTPGNTNNIETDGYKIFGQHYKYCMDRFIMLVSEYHDGGDRLFRKYNERMKKGSSVCGNIKLNVGESIELLNN